MIVLSISVVAHVLYVQVLHRQVKTSNARVISGFAYFVLIEDNVHIVIEQQEMKQV